ncbi:hypothetical protein [Paracidobacterium acidisoli]|uniref:hypothetical protein n=1 Tax=Paracidobacterium acidisoli TaxID=2303751 RepID=UPI0011C1B06D|nr:hypothetical protein [Paracidobacterium acidisoli]MBT9331568.1 hypothetical protein [Paracidobacterium acidisoli]
MHDPSTRKVCGAKGNDSLRQDFLQIVNLGVFVWPIRLLSCKSGTYRGIRFFLAQATLCFTPDNFALVQLAAHILPS